MDYLGGDNDLEIVDDKAKYDQQTGAQNLHSYFNIHDSNPKSKTRTPDMGTLPKRVSSEDNSYRILTPPVVSSPA